MIITCSHCSMRLQLDDAKVPSGPFTLRCPKCQNIVSIQPPPDASYEHHALTVGNSPASEHPRKDASGPLSPFKLDASMDRPDNAVENETSSSEVKDLVRTLGTLLKRGIPTTEQHRGAARYGWEMRRVLVCVDEAKRVAVESALGDSEYQVHVARNRVQAVERMREERIDIVILEASFDQAEQGAAFVLREINGLRPTERRRLFLVQLTDIGRSMDAHIAFINNVSFIVNPEDMNRLAPMLDRGLREYNELYRNFNEALQMSAL